MLGRGGQPEAYCHRAMLDAIRYLVENGSKRRAMPGNFPPWGRVYAFLRRRCDHAMVTCSPSPASPAPSSATADSPHEMTSKAGPVRRRGRHGS
ncbi:transposase [Streptomyces sp. NPDC048434]|uniref:transposase n=1 Tax=Streptomyces sp. NPDC048434 TaxID=3365549 RepID=UPI0037140B53